MSDREYRPTHRPRTLRMAKAVLSSDREAIRGAMLAMCQRKECEQWRLAALLKDRTRRAIRNRCRAGETASSLAEDYGVPLAFVEALVAWQLFGER